MIKQEFNLLDNVFSHDNYSVAGRESKYITWNRYVSNTNLPTFYSHEKMSEIEKNLTPKEKSYAIVFESRGIIPHIYKDIEKYIPKFNKVFTHNSDFLKKYDNCYWIPGGGVWVGGNYGKGEINLFEKTKLCSMVSSKKQMCELHRFRLEIINKVKNKNVDIFGIDRWVTINKSLEDYMFSIVVENYQDELYFTEKILNCFATGTIPIYLGPKNIGEKFNEDGIIQFNNLLDLEKILIGLTPENYFNKIESIRDNFNRCQNYLSIEDYIYTNYFIDGEF